MEKFFAQFENIFSIVLQFIIIAIEIIGVVLMVYVFVKAIIAIIRKEDKIGVNFSKGFMLVLQLLTAGELLATIIVHTYEHLIILAVVVAIRLAMGLFAMKELHEERKREHEEKMDYLRAELTTAEEIKEQDKKNAQTLD